MVLVQPPAAIAGQKVQYFRFAIIKQPRIPCWMIVSFEILRWITREIAQAFDFIFSSMSMNDVNDDAQSQSVRRVNQPLKIIGRAKPRRHREKVADVIAKTAIIRVLGDSH